MTNSMKSVETFETDPSIPLKSSFKVRKNIPGATVRTGRPEISIDGSLDYHGSALPVKSGFDSLLEFIYHIQEAIFYFLICEAHHMSESE